jgi:hypothetical protein
MGSGRVAEKAKTRLNQPMSSPNYHFYSTQSACATSSFQKKLQKTKMSTSIVNVHVRVDLGNGTIGFSGGGVSNHSLGASHLGCQYSYNTSLS